MKKVFLILTILTLSVIGLNAQTKKDGTPDMRYKANKQTYSTPAPTTTTTSTSRPIYSEPTHSSSHGGTYPGSTNSHHKDGTYANPSSNNRYGVHKKRG
jgi:uncharacterized lipoprotein NlpE involved in copper resistance